MRYEGDLHMSEECSACGRTADVTVSIRSDHVLVWYCPFCAHENSREDDCC